MGISWSSRPPVKDPMEKLDKNILVYGRGATQGIIAVQADTDKAEVSLFRRVNGQQGVILEKRPFRPFLLFSGSVADSVEGAVAIEELTGGDYLDRIAFFTAWKDLQKCVKRLSSACGISPGSPEAPYLYIRDPVQQYLLFSGETLFKEMQFSELRRMQVDIECITTPGYEFCNSEREGDRIVAIGVGCPDGSQVVLASPEYDEASIISKLVELIVEWDPDVIEGHNIFNFDLPYIAARAKRAGVGLNIGRDGSAPARRPSRISLAERTISYERFDIFGRHVIDTFFLVQAYDITHRSLSGYGLKEAAIHFGIAAEDRTYIAGEDISATYEKNPALLLDYVKGDISETNGLSALLSVSSFLQSRMLPFSYQDVAVRGNATKIDALMLRAYLGARASVPMPQPPKEFSGGYTDMFIEGVVEDVHHCDVRSLYPSLMLERDIRPRNDRLGCFLDMLAMLREFRFEARRKMSHAKGLERDYYDNLQSTSKVLINSFYGYLGFSQGRFCDFEAAERVTTDGRNLLKDMIAALRDMGAVPVEIDTDGIYFVPPEDSRVEGTEACSAFRKAFAATLPRGIEVEFDGAYEAMFSYKMKNYALLSTDGEVTIKGAALKSRGLEPFLRDFLEELVRMLLKKEFALLPSLKDRYDKAVVSGALDIRKLAKTETLQEPPAAYLAKVQKSKRNRNAAYELALKAERQFRQGDQVSYYVTGARKSVAVYDNCRMLSDWNPGLRDENKAYYLAKIEALYEKIAASFVQAQGELGL